MFDRLISRVIIHGTIQAETGLHIGTGNSSLDPSATDSPVIRDALGKPFIPGSSFKGALRSHLERIVRGLGRDTLRACDPLASPCISNDDFNEIKKKAEIGAKDGGQINRVKYDGFLTAEIENRSCDVCGLFGSNYVAAHTLIRDLFIDTEWQAVRVELRDGVGIDRDTETARQGVKYDFEVVPALTRFKLEIAVENARAELLGLLAIGLREMEQGRVSIGGKTTRGLGSVTLTLEEIEVAGDDVASDLQGEGNVDLVDYLIAGRGRKLKGPALHQYFKIKLNAFAAAKL
jgi:CRISPR-associated protein Csm3